MAVLVKKPLKAFLSEKKKAIEFAKPTISASIIKEPKPVMLVQGRPAKSTYEWYIAQALDKHHVSYSYQVPYGGGSLVHGGIILDFLATTNVQWAIDVRGSYWHRGDDISFFSAMHKYNPRAIILIARDENCQNVGTAESFLRTNGVF